MTTIEKFADMPQACENIDAEPVPGGIILSRRGHSNGRRVLFVNSYGGPNLWREIREGLAPTHHLWGCIELLARGYTVLVSEPIKHFSIRGRILPHDLKYHRHLADWLRRDDILFSAHTLLYWIPLLHQLGYRRRVIVSLTYAREQLDFPRAHRGVIALTPAAADEARRVAPHAKVAMLGWGVDLGFYPVLPYNPKFFLSCGRTERDFGTLARGVGLSGHVTSIVSAKDAPGVVWPTNAKRVGTGGPGDSVPFSELVHHYYAHCTASIIALNADPREKTAVGFTAAIEAMAMARPVIVTHTGAMPGVLDLVKRRCGIAIPVGDAQALADAMRVLHDDPATAAEMGVTGRQHCEEFFNINRYASDLDAYFQSL
ncbi:MAG: glycosyltransferase [Opitutaceae bacterium]|nr:glycosyltransferase [Opitutaceae bacterium]